MVTEEYRAELKKRIEKVGTPRELVIAGSTSGVSVPGAEFWNSCPYWGINEKSKSVHEHEHEHVHVHEVVHADARIPG